MFLVLAGVLLAAFVANVALGSVDGSAPLGDVAEMVLLFAAAIAFTAAILRREARAAALRRDLPSEAEPGGGPD